MHNTSPIERLHTSVYNETAIEHIHRYIFACQLVKNKHVLDLACGEGYGSNLLADVAKKVVGLDVDHKTIQNAEKKYNKKNLSFICCDASKLCFDDNFFDIVVSFETIEHLENQELFLKEVKRVLKHNGILILSTPNKKKFSDERNQINPYHIREFYLHEFETLINNEFKNSHILTQDIYNTSFIHSNSKKDLPDIYIGDFKHFEIYNTEGLFFITVASDDELPLINSSYFNASSMFHIAIKEIEKEIKKSYSYRAGHLLLYPFKLLQNLFQKK